MRNTTLNIDNLTALWKTASTPFQGSFNSNGFEYAYIEDTEWPNRVWMNKQSSPLPENIKEKLGNKHHSLTLSLFGVNNKRTSIENNDRLQLKSSQYGMSLKLDHKFKIQTRLELKKVEHIAEAKKWSNAFFMAFGYEISAKIVLKTKDHISFYLVYFKKELVGTVVLFITNKVAGIHSLGILPHKRKQGFATETMHHILNKAIDLNLSLATLQASEMAKAIYLKMNFSVDFIMENYTLGE